MEVIGTRMGGPLGFAVGVWRVRRAAEQLGEPSDTGAEPPPLVDRLGTAADECGCRLATRPSERHVPVPIRSALRLRRRSREAREVRQLAGQTWLDQVANPSHPRSVGRGGSLLAV